PALSPALSPTRGAADARRAAGRSRGGLLVGKVLVAGAGAAPRGRRCRRGTRDLRRQRPFPAPRRPATCRLGDTAESASDSMAPVSAPTRRPSLVVRNTPKAVDGLCTGPTVGAQGGPWLCTILWTTGGGSGPHRRRNAVVARTGSPSSSEAGRSTVASITQS